MWCIAEESNSKFKVMLIVSLILSVCASRTVGSRRCYSKPELFQTSSYNLKRKRWELGKWIYSASGQCTSSLDTTYKSSFTQVTYFNYRTPSLLTKSGFLQCFSFPKSQICAQQTGFCMTWQGKTGNNWLLRHLSDNKLWNGFER